MEYVASLIKDGLMDKSQLERDGTQVENQFKGGKIAVWIGGPWVLGSAERTDDEKWVEGRPRRTSASPRCRRARRARRYTFVGGSDLMMFKSLQAPGRGLGSS